MKPLWLNILDGEFNTELLFPEGHVFQHQLFAAEDEGRTEPPSERRRREERSQGNVPKSQELSSTIVMLGAVVVLYFFGNKIFMNSGMMIRKYFMLSLGQENFEMESLRILLKQATYDALYLLMPILAICFVLAILGNIVQFGFLFSPEALGFKWNRIVPNFKRVLPNRQTLFTLGKSVIKIIIIGIISYLIISSDYKKLLMTNDMGLEQSLSYVTYTGFKLFLSISILLLAIGLVDFFYQRFEYEENLKQTPSEAKQELKEEVGNPELTRRRRQMVRDIANRGMLKKVPEADVVITNPTHFAIALQYRFGVDIAPVILAKGEGELALMIKRIAKNSNVPMVENRPLAQLLYKEGEIGQVIPYKLFEAVANILRTLEKYNTAGRS
jgi:flagellar biosynthetic protein FlhB